MTESTLTHSKKRIKTGIISFYLSQGLCFSSWASRIPDFKDHLGVNDKFIWGIILFMIPIGKFLAIPLSGYSVPKFGSKTMVQVSIMGYIISLFFAGVSTDIYQLGACLFMFGVFWNLMDISLNTQGIGIEKLLGKHAMGSFHGSWSFGACFGALVGFLMINLQISLPMHYSIILVTITAIWLLNRKYLQNDIQEKQIQPKVKEHNKQGKLETVLIQLGLIGLFALIIESAMFDWGGVYFETVVKAPKSLQIGFLIFMVMMTVGRFSINKSYDIFGKKRTIQIAGILIFAGMSISALFPSFIFSSLGFMMVGLGISCVVPTIYSVVGQKSKIPVSIALTILSTISFVGSLIAPLLIGSISQNLNMEYAYMTVGVFGLVIVLITTFTNALNDQKITE